VGPQGQVEETRVGHAPPEPAEPGLSVVRPAAHPLIQLQRSAGNQAVQGLVTDPARQVIQRQPRSPGDVEPVARRRGRPEGEAAPALPRSMLIELALERLNEPEIRDFPGIKLLRAELERELASPAGPDEERKRRHIERLHRTLSVTQSVFKPLNALASPDNYLPGVQKVILSRVNEIKGLYAAAILMAYSDSDPEETSLGHAEQRMQGLPAFIVEKYLGPYGITRIIDQLAELSQQIQKLRAAGDVKAAHGPLNYTLGDPQRLAAREAELRRDLEAARAARGDPEKSTDTIRELTAKAQAMVGVTTAVALYEQFTFWTNELRESFADIAIELGSDIVELGSDIVSPVRVAGADAPVEEKEVWEIPLGYALELERIVTDFMKLDQVTDPERAREITDDGLRRLAAIVNTPAFERDVKRIQDRLETVQTVNVLATVVLIAAAAALTAGVAGAAVGGALQFAGAGAFAVGTGKVVAGALAFTVVSREGQKLAFGKAEGSFGWDFVTNALMFGWLKGVNMAFTQAFKIGPSAGAAAKLAYGLGHAGTAMIALQAFAQAEHMVKEKRPLTGDEHAQVALQNLVVLVALSAGRFITSPIETRITSGVAARLGPRFKTRLENLAADREGLGAQLDALKRHEGPHEPKMIEGLLRRIQAIWEKELRLLDYATKRKMISEAELHTILARYRAQLASLELQLARLNVQAQLGTGTPGFRPVAHGVVLFSPGAEKALRDFHTENKGELRDSRKHKGVLEGRIGGELTYYVPEGKAFARLPEAARLAAVRDAALREAAADPEAQVGLENLGKTFGTLKADEVLVAAQPEHLGALLRAMADPEVVTYKRPEFYGELAKNRAAMDFSQAYGAKTLRNLARFGWEALGKDILPRARAKIEEAPTPDARAEIIRMLQTEGDVVRLGELLGKARPPRPPRPVRPTKRNLGVDRRLAMWTQFRGTEVRHATRHNETPTPEQLDQRADVLLILDRAKSGAFDHIKEHNSKVEIINRFEELCLEAGIDRGRTNALRGSLSEVLIRPVRFEPKRAFLDGKEVPWNTAGASKLDYSLTDNPAFTEWVEQKSDVLSGGHRRRDRAFEVGVAAARKYRKDAIDDLKNLPPGDKLSLEFIREPDPATKKVMLQVLFGPGSPVYRVRFGGRGWETRP
jgi:hypothetical protein